MFIFFLATLIRYEITATINVVDKGIVPLEKHSVGIQFYIDLENENRESSCSIHTRTRRCCLTDSETEDCDIIHVYTTDLEIQPRDRGTLIFVYPTLFQHDQMGYCIFDLNYRCGKGRLSRQSVNIPLDTSVYTGKHVPAVLQSYVIDSKRVQCSFIDEDSLNNCTPVNCDQKYSSARPVYDPNLSRCVKAARCQGNPQKELPDIVLDPKNNVCKDLDKPLTAEDILEISRGLFIVTIPPKFDDQMMVEFKSNCSTISQNLYFLRDMVMGKFCPMNLDTTEYRNCFKTAVMKIVMCIVAVCVVYLSIVFCLSFVVWISKKIRDGSLHTTWQCFQSKFKKLNSPRKPDCKYKVSRVDADVRNSLLKQVIVRDIPMELRDSVVNICDRMDKEVKWKRRYRKDDIGSQVSLDAGIATSETSSENDDEESTLLK